MEIKDQTMTMATDEKGNEYVAEIQGTFTETLEDGTVATADITTTANEETGRAESYMTVTATAEDGTETVSEYVVNDEGTFKVEESAAEQAFEALTGVEIEDNLVQVDPQTGEPLETSDVYEADSDYEFEAADADSTATNEVYSPTFEPVETTDVFSAETPVDTTFGTVDSAYTATPVYDSTFGTTTTTDSTYSAVSETDAAEIAEQEAHTQAAKDAQNAADEFIAQGDYTAAAEARETAENEAWEAKDDSMLSAYNAQDLSYAAEKQEDAAFYEQQQAEYAQAGDYESAKESAQNAAYAMNDADINAGGSDHTGQADSEVTNMDNALWQESLAEDDLDNAAWHAEMGNTDAADASLDSAVSHQEMADTYGDLGTHGGDTAYYDPSSEVATGGTYDSSFDASAIDTGFDSTYDTTATSTYDTGTDDV